MTAQKTKKSAAKKSSKKQGGAKKNNAEQAAIEVQGLHDQAREMINSALTMTQVLKHKEILNYPEIHGVLAEYGTILLNDIERFQTRLAGIRDKSVAIQNQDECDALFEYITIAEDYRLFIEEFAAIIDPTMTAFTNVLDQIEDIKKERAKSTQEAPQKPVPAPETQNTPTPINKPVSTNDLMAMATGNKKQRTKRRR